MQLEDRILLSVAPGPVVADGDLARTDGALDALAAATDGDQSTGTAEATPDSDEVVRTAEDTLSLLESLSDDLAAAQEEMGPSDSSETVVRTELFGSAHEPLAIDLESPSEGSSDLIGGDASDWQTDAGVADATQQTGTLLQFTTETGHVLGFGQTSIIVASPSHMLQVEFVGANLVGPAAADATPMRRRRRVHERHLRRPLGRGDGRLRRPGRSDPQEHVLRRCVCRRQTPPNRSACTTTAT